PVISVLPSAVADQIAAGEVVERPASVVKELVENSMDAGARAVEITVQEGGRALIRISDDGAGMDPDDAVLSLARHGTSKIRTSADLTGVRTFGFRGEALPAICSVSRIEIETALQDGSGTRLTAAGGGPPAVAPTQRRRGTTVTVTDLFYNAPARAKFLRGSRSEWRAISEIVMTLALTRRDIRFDLSHDGRRAFTAPPASSLRVRLGALWGVQYADGLLDVDDVAGPIHVSGLVERPANVGTATRRVFLSVNGRAIRDAGIVRGAETAYRSTIPAGTRPALYLEVSVPTDSIDVNVHPAKAEIRFQDRWTVERAVERAVRRALGSFDSSASMGRSFFGGIAAASEPVQVVESQVLAPQTNDTPLFRPVGSVNGSSHVEGDETAARDVATADRTREDDSIPPLTQLRRTYIMFEHEDGVVLIDQHSAHERVLYEEFMQDIERGSANSQRLLLPFTLTLSAQELEAFDLNRQYFDRLGFEIDAFGGNSLIVHAVPVPHPRFDAERCLRDTLASLTGDRTPSAHGRHERLVATIACKAAVKGGDLLSGAEMRALFIALRDTNLPAHDVHGRSTIVQLAWSEVDRRFGRS
ncbi:MAG TPA: DNA mismatch repair endonuclease MutL, partial [Gemmatimonadaceae bacterium]|nr:DNA mismatch repair endonuclease MutL [Gemmatimonadaceae bacterium]